MSPQVENMMKVIQEAYPDYDLNMGVDVEMMYYQALKELTSKTDKALRYNYGKPKWSLVHFQSLEPMVRVLEYGTKKYTKKLNFDIENIIKVCHSAKTIQIEKLSPKDFVDLVTTDSSKLRIRTIEESKEKMSISGWSRMEKSIEREELENILWSRRRKSSSEKRREELGDMDSPLNNTRLLNYKDALFVNQRSVYMLTIATKQENSEEFYVASATRDLDCLMMIFTNLKLQQIISNDIQVTDNQISIAGRDNWKKGLDKSAILESMMRHLVALMDGQEIDPESNEHHIGHIMCNALFYSYFNVIGGDKSTK